MTPLPRPGRLAAADVLALGAHGLRTRPARVALSALGIAIGITAMVAVLAVPASSARALHDRLAALGTNLLTAGPGKTLTGAPSVLPDTAVPMSKRIAPVTASTAVGSTGQPVRRSDLVPRSETSGLAAYAATPDLLGVLGGEVRSGTFLGDAGAHPVVVLGSVAAARLGVDRVEPGTTRQVLIGDTRFTVVGVLGPMPLAPEVERSALVGWDSAKEHLGFDGHPSTVYLRAREDSVEEVRGVLARTLNPANPGEVEVVRPSEALKAQEITESANSALFLGLGAVALLVGGVGVANTMVISVLERRREIGLRRALGATRRQVRGQFLAESVLLSGLGGLCGVLAGVLVTTGYALSRGWPAVFPVQTLAGGIGLAVLVGAVAGAYPASRAARLAPVAALA
ncbi:ABC transporter permease [Umezawaea beigongshangensis]|uniref:ABC transporter permease n=1 Tax=Umezawaea beigongshangensis TaxID=2780383 RepID=UPI0018F2469E|nr:ABC transporter permease [Umezawaea beigongshangensis]